MKKHLVLLVFLIFFLRVNAQQSININTLSVTTQPTRFEVARIYIDVVNWNHTGNLEIDLKEKFFSAGLKKTYTVSYGIGVSPIATLKDMSGIGNNYFQLSMGTEVTVAGTIKYVPVYIDLRNYAQVDVVLRTNWALTTDAGNTTQGYLYYNQSPVGFNIDDFSPDATVFLSYSAANTVLSGNVGIGNTTPGYMLDVHHIGTGSALNITGSAIGTRNDVGIDFSASNGTIVKYANIGLQITDGTVNHETGGLTFSTINNGTLSEKMFINNAGYVGIGTTSPAYKLDVNGSLHTAGDSELGSGFLHISTDQNFDTQANYTFRDGVGINNPNGSSFAAGEAVMSIGAMSNGTSIITTGNIAIGTNDSRGYKLAVAGNAIAESMTVKLQSAWGDYVFKKDYALMPLSDVKTYIDKNQHLPEIPAAAEVEKDGVNLGEMNRLLVKKVEELTLYLIEKDKQLKEQQTHVQLLEESYRDQKAQLNSLKTAINQLISNPK